MSIRNGGGISGSFQLIAWLVWLGLLGGMLGFSGHNTSEFEWVNIGAIEKKKIDKVSIIICNLL